MSKAHVIEPILAVSKGDEDEVIGSLKALHGGAEWKLARQNIKDVDQVS